MGKWFPTIFVLSPPYPATLSLVYPYNEIGSASKIIISSSKINEYINLKCLVFKDSVLRIVYSSMNFIPSRRSPLIPV